MACVVTKGHRDIRGRGCHLGPYGYLSVMLLLEPYRYEWPTLPPRSMVLSRSGLQARTISESVALEQLWSVLMALALLTLKVARIGLHSIGPIHHWLHH